MSVEAILNDKTPNKVFIIPSEEFERLFRDAHLYGYAEGVVDTIFDEKPRSRRITDNPRSAEDIHD